MLLSLLGCPIPPFGTLATGHGDFSIPIRTSSYIHGLGIVGEHSEDGPCRAQAAASRAQSLWLEMLTHRVAGESSSDVCLSACKFICLSVYQTSIGALFAIAVMRRDAETLTTAMQYTIRLDSAIHGMQRSMQLCPHRPLDSKGKMSPLT